MAKRLRDVEQDWYKIFGRLPTVLKEPPEQKNWEAPIIYLGLNAPWLKKLNKQKFTGQKPPAPTLPRERYPIIYRYQEKAKENFPLFYPKEKN